ncbi:hypothetical protein ACFYNO_38130 [Kitasatospora sp. NPDC006697]|uniref:hypothetical protein n=1 Tax=Kitasatospora sp. NPDC006697 TaxID=3364020 RepID=UPI0036A76D5F
MGNQFGKKLATVGAGAALVTSVLMAMPAAASAAPAQPNMVYADCAVGTYGSNNDGVTISCGDVVGGQARGRGDCAFAPDVYTPWIGSWYDAWSGFCLFSLRGPVLETKAA